jgi:hypothetical protein
MAPDNPTADLARLLREIARLETELKTASLRDPWTLAEYARKIRQLQLEVLAHKRPLNARRTK